MRKVNPLRPIFAVSIVASLTCFIASCPVRAAEGTVTAPIAVSASLDTKPTVTLGEPVIVRYNVTNLSGQKVGVRWGENGAAWYSLQLTDGQGVSVAPALSQSTSQTAGSFAVNNPFIAVGSAFPGYLVVTRLFSIPHPGKYTLTMHIELPYTPVATNEESPVVLNKLIDTNGNTLSEDETVSFTVTSANSTRLAESAKALQHQIDQTSDVNRLSSLMDALFSMPANAAFISWQSLASNPQMNVALIANELVFVHSESSADLLASMYDNSSLSPDDRAFVGQQLNKLYNAGDETLKTHIQQIAAVHGFSLPDKIPIPLVTD
jgi:hypothetical protein